MKNTQNGFTLIELIIYIALIAIFISGAIRFGLTIVYGNAKSNVQREVNQNLRLIANRISYEIRNASAVNSILTTDVCLANTDASRNPTRIYQSSGTLRIAWGGGSTDCTAMTYDEQLSANSITVSNLTFVDHSSGSLTHNIEYTFTISSTGDREEWQKSETYNSTVELRSHP